MIEREFVAHKTKEFFIKKYVEDQLKHVGISQIRLKKIPLGEKIIIDTSRPSLVVGSKGANIRNLTKDLKKKFKLENPQIEINEIRNIYLDAAVVAEQIASSLERFGAARFKGVGHKMIENVMNAGAMGVEIILSGKIPGARAKSWRFYLGYLKKCGDIALSGVRTVHRSALLKSGIIGIKVSIMPPNLVLPDKIDILNEPIPAAGPAEGDGRSKDQKEQDQKETKEKNRPKKRSPKKKAGEKSSDLAGSEVKKPTKSAKGKTKEKPKEKSLPPIQSTAPEFEAEKTKIPAEVSEENNRSNMNENNAEDKAEHITTELGKEHENN